MLTAGYRLTEKESSLHNSSWSASEDAPASFQMVRSNSLCVLIVQSRARDSMVFALISFFYSSSSMMHRRSLICKSFLHVFRSSSLEFRLLLFCTTRRISLSFWKEFSRTFIVILLTAALRVGELSASIWESPIFALIARPLEPEMLIRRPPRSIVCLLNQRSCVRVERSEDLKGALKGLKGSSESQRSSACRSRIARKHAALFRKMLSSDFYSFP